MHQRDLLLDHPLAILAMLHRRALKIQVLRVNRILVQKLIKLGAQILHPVVPGSALAMMPQRLDIDDTRDISRNSAVILTPYDLPAIIDDERIPAERIDGFVARADRIRAEVWRNYIHIVIQRAGAALDFEIAVAGG